MISLETALQLKNAGLVWVPSQNDFFAIPERGMDEKVFVISDLLVTVDQLQGLQVVSFQGASEWALDYLVTADTVWLPREDQLRLALEAALIAGGHFEVRLVSRIKGCRCSILYKGKRHSFRAATASEAYAQALLHVLPNTSLPAEN